MNMGLNTASDRTYLAPGELAVATGAYYKPGDTQRLWKMLGRTSYGDGWAASQAGVGIALCAFDTAANDRLVITNDNGEYHSSVLSASDPTAGTFTTVTTGLRTGSSILSWAHFNDVWFLGDNLNDPFALKSDGTFRHMGLKPPEGSTTAVRAANAMDERPTTATWTGSEWADVTSIYDPVRDPAGVYLTDQGDPFRATFGYTEVRMWLDGVIADDFGTFKSVILSGFAANTGNGRFIEVVWGLNGEQSFIDYADALLPYTPENNLPIFTVDVKFEVSTNSGSSWQTLENVRYNREAPDSRLLVEITDGQDIANYQIRISLAQQTFFTFATPSPAYLSVFDVHITDRGWLDAFNTNVGFHYAVAQAIPADNLEGPLAAPVFVTMSNHNTVRLSLPQPRDAGRTGAITNPAATHWVIYRTFDGGTVPNDLRRLAQVPISNTIFLDTFSKPINDESGQVPPFLKLILGGSTPQFFVSNTPPAPFKAIVEYQNFLVAVSSRNQRELMYSLPNRPEYWPLLRPDILS